MRPGPPRGDSTSVELTVTDDLAAASAPGVAAVCTPASLLDAGERVCRDLVAPHLETGETAVAVKVDLALRSPLPVGVTAQLVATVAVCTPSTVTYEVLVRQGGTLAARGSVEHRVVDVDTLAGEVAARTGAATP